jgi:hypothetical protein
MKIFSRKKKTSDRGTTLPKCLVFRISELSDVGLKELCHVYMHDSIAFGLTAVIDKSPIPGSMRSKA